jgi:demethylmenaquinone methyltransferase/2-methoxy-6-polyprenyl-1,4-benzoquinol methylase
MTSAAQSPPPGTRPEGASTEHEARQFVRRMFGEIAVRYDLLNHLLSGNLDRLWRRRAAAAFDHILRRPHARVLDLCCGTGDLALALKRRATHSCSPGALVFAGDFSHPMLVRAVEKSHTANCARAAEIAWLEADALSPPFAPGSFDLITIAWGFRNLINYEAGLQEFFRLLRPGGELGILDCAEPRGLIFGSLFRFYFRKVVPRVGGAISRNTSAYAYLPASVQKFPAPDALARMMSDAGFVGVGYQLWTAGSIALHTGKRPALQDAGPATAGRRGEPWPDIPA